MPGQYILDENGNPVLETDLMKWGAWMEHRNLRSIASDTLPDGTLVSTIFLGFDHSWDAPPPVLWETMVFGGEHDQFQDRYSSLEDAKAGHAAALALAKGEMQA